MQAQAPFGLRHLHLSHFRSHRRADLGFDGRPVALWGANGAGKTNILEAVSLLSPGRGLRRAPPEDLARRPESLGWRIRAEIAGGAGRADLAPQLLETGAQPGQSRQLRINDKPAPQAQLARILRLVWLTPAMDRLWIEAPEGRRRFLDRLTLSFEPDHAEAVLAYDKAMRERNRLLKDQRRDGAWYLALERQMAQEGARIQAHRAATLQALRAAQAAAGDSQAFPVADLALIGPEGSPDPQGAAELAEALARGRARDMAAGRSLIGPHRADLSARYAAKSMPAAQASTGEQKALLLSLVLANVRALAALGGAPTLLLLDEVAAHLDGARRAALYDAICGLGVQALMTGTERALFTELGPRAQAFEIRETAEGSAIEDRSLG